MRKTLFLIFTFSLTAIWLISCGDSSTKVTPQTPLPSVAFLQGPSDGTGMLTPMTGTFNSNGQFVTNAVIDTGTGQPVATGINSIILSSDHTQATLDLYGGLDGTSDQWDIWVAASDLNTNPVQITNDVYQDVEPQFSRDGTKIVYASYRPIPGDLSGNYQWQIVVRSSTPGGSELVLPIPSGIEYQMAPAFSPDGSKIVMMADGYISDYVPFAGILITNVDGSNPQTLTNPLYSKGCYYCADQLPAFTANGSQIVFSRDNWNQSPETEDIYIMNADGSNVTQLTDGVGLNSDPLTTTIDNVGERILFNSNRDNLSFTTGDGFCLYMMKTDGTGFTRLTNNTLFDGFSTWWYDGPGSGAATARHTNRLSRQFQPFHRTVLTSHGWHH